MANRKDMEILRHRMTVALSMDVGIDICPHDCAYQKL